MFQSDLDALFMGKEKHQQCLREIDNIRKVLSVKKTRTRIQFRVWLGTQFIVLGQRLKGGQE